MTDGGLFDDDVGGLCRSEVQEFFRFFGEKIAIRSERALLKMRDLIFTHRVGVVLWGTLGIFKQRLHGFLHCLWIDIGQRRGRFSSVNDANQPDVVVLGAAKQRRCIVVHVEFVLLRD